jgi:restriction endonuclease S subunit
MTVQKRQIKDIADLILGHSFRTAPGEQSDKFYKLIQVKDIDTSGELLVNQIENINHKFSRSVELVEPGDIIFCPREHKLVSALITSKFVNAIISAPLILIRVRCQQSIKPEYLRFYLNSAIARRDFHHLLMGSAILTLKKSDLGNFKVPVPSIEVQEAVSKLYQYSEQEQKIRERLMKLRKEELEQTLNHKIEQLLAV